MLCDPRTKGAIRYVKNFKKAHQKKRCVDIRGVLSDPWEEVGLSAGHTERELASACFEPPSHLRFVVLSKNARRARDVLGLGRAIVFCLRELSMLL